MNIKIKAEFDKLSILLDKRDKFFAIMQEFEARYGYVPDEYEKDVKLMNQFARYKRIGGWRNDKKAVRTLEQAARKTARNI
jgi:hypothetical protein